MLRSIVEAEKGRVLNKHIQAADYYDKAIELAKENGYIQEEALANEVAGRYYLSIDKKKIAKIYLQEAYELYKKWGAEAKISALNKKYPELFKPQSYLKDKQSDLSSGKTIFAHNTSEVFDLSTIIKVSQTLSKEVILSEVLKKMMKIIIENAGAQKVVLLLERNGKWFIEAQGLVDNAELDVLHSIPIEEVSNEDNNHFIPKSIINYVIRTKENVILNNASKDNRFVNDPYVLKNDLKSVLCFPLIYQGSHSTVIYLENNQTAGVFTYERIKVLELLSSQAAISIENAKLYKQLKDSETQYRSIFENSIEGIFQISHDGHFINANNSMARMLGYHSSEELITSTIKISKQFLVNPEDNNEFVRLLIENGKVANMEGQGVRKDGSVFWGSISARAVCDENAHLLYYEGSLVDITERKQKERAEREKEIAQASARSKSEFLANMSHEIRTPMNAILGFTELLEGKIKEPQNKQYLSAISSSGKTLLTLINDILDLSKIEAGKLELRYESVNPRSILNEIKQMFSRKVNEKGIEFLIDVDQSLPQKMILDEVRLRQILVNLTGNAIKFVDKGFIKLSLNKRSAESENLELIFAVQDTGIGIPKDQQNRMFEAFEQQKGQSAAKYGGTGLGLAITKRLVEMMGGEISVESEVGKGSTFNVVLKNVAMSSETDAVNSKNKTITDSIKFEKSSILIVDDVEYNRLLLKGFLNYPEIKLFEAENGRDAINLAKLHHPSVILMDMKMPVMDGYEATRILKGDNDLKSIPVIAITASVMIENEAKITDAGCEKILKKPVNKETLISELIRFLPYTKEETDDKQIQIEIKEETISPEIKAGLPELLSILENEVKNKWKTVSSKFIFDEIEQFANEIKELGERYGLNILLKWGEELYQQVMDFDMEKLPQTLEHFPELVTVINKISKGEK